MIDERRKTNYDWEKMGQGGSGSGRGRSEKAKGRWAMSDWRLVIGDWEKSVRVVR